MEPYALLEIVSRLKESGKYRNICSDTLYRMAGWALKRNKSPKQAIKAAKRKLHQVYGAYFKQMNMATIEALVDGLPPRSEDGRLRDTCRQLLRCHSSTRERLPVMEKVFCDLFQKTGRPKAIVDLACGLNPFAWPWMNLEPDTRYHAMDIDCRMIGHINTFFSHLGMPQSAVCHDILTSVPSVKSDVVFLFKALPVIEQQERGRSLKLLKDLQTHTIVVSFPTKSLGSREKGMQQHYGDFMNRLIEELDTSVRIMDVPNEVFYIIDKKG